MDFTNPTTQAQTEPRPRRPIHRQTTLFPIPPGEGAYKKAILLEAYAAMIENAAIVTRAAHGGLREIRPLAGITAVTVPHTGMLLGDLSAEEADRAVKRLRTRADALRSGKPSPFNTDR